MADANQPGAKRALVMVLLLISVAGIGYGGYLMATDRAGMPAMPFFIGAAICGALAAVFGASGAKKP